MYFGSINQKDIQKLIFENFKRKQNQNKVKGNRGIVSQSECSYIKNQSKLEHINFEGNFIKSGKTSEIKKSNILEEIDEEYNISKDELSKPQANPNENFINKELIKEKEEETIRNEISDNKDKMPQNSIKLSLNNYKDSLGNCIKIERSAIYASNKYYKC